MAICDPEEGMHKLFRGVVAGTICGGRAGYGGKCDAARIVFLAGNRREIAAVIIEPLIQGAGGMKFHDARSAG